MAVKPPDFKASGIRAERLIASGSTKKPQLLIINESTTGNNGITVDTDTLKLTGTGSDTWLFISGAIGGNDRVTFGGDVYISGSLYGVTVSATPASPVNAVQFNSAGIFGGSSNLTFIGSNQLSLTGSSYVKGFTGISGSSAITGSLVIKDDIADTSQLTLSSSAGNTIFNMYNDGTFYLTNNKSSGQIAVGVTQPDATGSQVLKIYPKNSQRSLTVFNESLAGSSAANPNLSSDTNFFVNGLISSRSTSNRGTAVFGGDLVTSGSLYSLSGISGSLTRLTDGTSYLRAGSNITIASSSNGAITISSTGGAGSSLFTDPAAGKINSTGSLALAGNLGSSYITSNVGSDVFFFTSGSIAGRGVSGTSVFGGDLVTSGSLYALNGNATISAAAGSSTITLSSAGGSTTLTETNSGNLEIRNTALAGQFVASVKTSNGVTSNFLDVRPNGSLTGSVISIFPSSIYAGAANPFNSSDTTFFVAGKNGAKGGNTRGTAVFGGDTVISGSAYLGTSNTDSLVVNSLLASDIIPDGNRTRNLGSDTARFANVYTGDLHLRNERGDYTLIEEEDCLTIRFNKTGKRYKFVLERAPEYDE
jgi:hypothetical protein